MRPGPSHPVGRLPVKRASLRLLVLLVPAQVQPLEAFENGVDRGVGIAFDVGIVEAQDHGSGVVAGV